ncbi:hypothetical protein EHI8A_032410 [Entamoeba histolytica HM-1:IMSS-B]|uniref:Uncharacterized protein n=4 Tax=Entamoeba histolytica TaxID=5759 RepID=C4LUI7_ENTH1|nr:hypothetical protein EHI_049890 [Entamoeba histolytica HM-1:IMSS]EAL51787.1 hypothetical protein EHI_049890 [Entamoeba histolytica HM-1:IMSS]EMH76388.1 hypothetical protein EHI8A_032410 [Entamoeba histolytica HM-1:IMSS-B]EMS15518.1 hypothetical protein KM1_074420 [Entamoeba histolytica HM-3:IMSS]ENY60369.1 hypothetical protein EHI7A_036930 [Entamoeba histolytica HM-1:IMSS-A]|eukprot:XP_657173.1 hypothetical protein EHI_049890 [Entamoeba histolytica HM-1:IMSS]
MEEQHNDEMMDIILQSVGPKDFGLLMNKTQNYQITKRVLSSYELNEMIQYEKVQNEFQKIKGDIHSEQLLWQKILNSKTLYQVSEIRRNRLPNDEMAKEYSIQPYEQDYLKHGIKIHKTQTSIINITGNGKLAHMGINKGIEQNEVTWKENESNDNDWIKTQIKCNKEDDWKQYILEKKYLEDIELKKRMSIIGSPITDINVQETIVDWNKIIGWCEEWNKIDIQMNNKEGQLNEMNKQLCFKMYSIVQQLVMMYWKSDEERKKKLKTLIDKTTNQINVCLLLLIFSFYENSHERKN